MMDLAKIKPPLKPSIWIVPWQDIPTLLLMKYGDDIRRVRATQDGNMLIDTTKVNEFYKGMVLSCLTPQARAAFDQQGTTNFHIRIEVSNVINWLKSKWAVKK